MDSNFTNKNNSWEYSLDIDDSDLHLTHVLCSSSSARVEPSPYTLNSVRIIPDPAGTVQLSSSTCFEPSFSTLNPVRIIPIHAGLVQQAKQLKEKVIILDPDGAVMSTQEYMQKVIEDVGADDNFNSGAWISAINYVISTGDTVTGCLGDINNFLKKRKLEQVIAIVKSCSPNALGDLNITMKDLSGTVRGTVHYKVLDVGSYGKDITNSDKSCVAKAYGRKEMLFCDRFCDDFVTLLRLYLLYGSAGVRVITAAGGRSYKENSSSWFLLVVPAGRLCGSYWSAYGFFCLPCSILFVIAASIIGPQTPLDLEQ
ncbi:hypothetical protein Tco_0970592 [Tanacetum coccineum]